MMQMAEEVVLEAQILSYDPNDHFGSMMKVKNIMEDFTSAREINLQIKSCRKFMILSGISGVKNFLARFGCMRIERKKRMSIEVL